MSYRDERDALESKRAALEAERSALAARKLEFEGLRERESEVVRELAETNRLLDASATGGKASALDDVRIASPCSAKWEDMVGDERMRFCGHCSKNVYNLSALERAEAEQFLTERTDSVCVRLYRRVDGTVLTTDCPVGVKKKRRRHLAVLAIGGGTLAGAALMSMRAATVTMGTRATMGELAMPIAPPPETGVVEGVPAPVPEPRPVLPTFSESPKEHAVLGRLEAKDTAPGRKRSGPEPRHPGANSPATSPWNER